MNLKNRLPISRVIGKVDNDFNIHESDWIPRVAAWVTDALAQMKVLPMEKKKRELEVSNRIAQFPCALNAKKIKVYDKNNCEIKPLENTTNGCNCSNTNSSNDKNFVLNGDQIELNFDTDSITVESYEVATYYDEYYNCEVPYIYDNGLLLEALSWYVLFKYLSRGSKHQVYDLKTNSPILNPYLQWTSLRFKAANAVKHDLNKETGGWNNFFYNATFLPRG